MGEAVKEVVSTVISIGLTVAGDVASFDEKKRSDLSQNLKKSLQCEEPDCILKMTISAGSVRVDVDLIIPSTSNTATAIASEVSSAAETLTTSDPSVLTSSLGVTVEAATPPVVKSGVAVAIKVAPPPPPAPPPASNTIVNSSTILTAAIVGGALVLVTIFAIYCFCRSVSAAQKRKKATKLHQPRMQLGSLPAKNDGGVNMVSV